MAGISPNWGGFWLGAMKRTNASVPATAFYLGRLCGPELAKRSWLLLCVRESAPAYRRGTTPNAKVLRIHRFNRFRKSKDRRTERLRDRESLRFQEATHGHRRKFSSGTGKQLRSMGKRLHVPGRRKVWRCSGQALPAGAVFQAWFLIGAVARASYAGWLCWVASIGF